MPTYTIQTPDRRTVRVQAPDYASAMRTAVREATGYLTTAARAVPFLTEAGAGWSAGVRSLDNLLNGRPIDPARDWTRARAEQQAVVDAFQREHPFASNNATALGTVAPMAAGGLGLVRAARPAALLSASNAGASGGGSAAETVLRNAFTGATVGGLYGAARPGTVRQRTKYALDSVEPGAVGGVAIPVAVRGIEFAAPRIGAVGSELADTLYRAVTGRTPVDQSSQLPAAADTLPQFEAIHLLRQTGVTPEGLEDAQKAALWKPITTAEAIGPSGMALAQGLRGRAGTTDATADEFLEHRAVTRPRRVLGDVQRATALQSRAILGDVGTILARNRGMAAPMFNDAYAQSIPIVNTPEGNIFQIMSHDEINPYYSKVKLAIRDKNRPFFTLIPNPHNLEGMPPAIPTMEALDSLKNELQNELIDEKGLPYRTKTILYDVEDKVHNLLSRNGSYAKGFNVGGDLFSTDAVLRSARGRVLDPSIDSSSFASEFGALPPFAQATAKAAAAGDVTKLGYYPPFDAAQLWDPTVREKLSFLFGDEGYASLDKSFGLENRMAQFEEGPPNGLAGLGFRLRAAARAPLNMAGRNALGHLLYQDPSVTAQIMRGSDDLPNAFDSPGSRPPSVPQYGWMGLGEMTSVPGRPSGANDP